MTEFADAFLGDLHRDDPSLLGAADDWEHLLWNLSSDPSDLRLMATAAMEGSSPHHEHVVRLLYWILFTALSGETEELRDELSQLITDIPRRTARRDLAVFAQRASALFESPPHYNVWDLYRTLDVEGAGTWTYAGKRRRRARNRGKPE